MSTLLFTLLGTLLFVSGYYLGNQMGRTQFIRNYLAEARNQRS